MAERRVYEKSPSRQESPVVEEKVAEDDAVAVVLDAPSGHSEALQSEPVHGLRGDDVAKDGHVVGPVGIADLFFVVAQERVDHVDEQLILLQ